MKTGRKSLLTREIQTEMIQALGNGLGIKASARAIGLSIPTMFRWLARGRSDQTGPYRDFYLAVQATWPGKQGVA